MKTRLIILFVLVSVGAVAAWRWVPWWQAYSQRQDEARQIAAYEVALDAEMTLGKLADDICSLEELAEQLRPQVAIPLELDRTAIRREHGTEPIRLKIGEASGPLHDILKEVLEPANLSFCRRGTALVITTREVAEAANQRRTLRQYVLPRAAGDGTPIDPASDEWYSVIMQAAGDNGWDSHQDHVEIAAGTVTACLTDESHRRVRRLLRQFEQFPEDPAASLSPFSPDERSILAALDQTVSVAWADEPLSEIGQLLRHHGIPSVFEERFLADAGVSPRTPVTLKLDDVSLRTILREALGQCKLDWVIRRGRLVITTVDDAESDELLIAYDVRDLVATAHGVRDFDSLIDLIMTVIEPDSWPEGSGPGPISELSPGWIVVPQTRDVHEKIADLLAMLRRAKIVGSARSWDRTSAGKKLAQALETEVKLEYYGETLKEVCDDLRQKLGINVVLDRPALADTVISAETPVECVLPPLPLADGLMLLEEKLSPQRKWLGEPRGVPFFQPSLPFPPTDLGYVVEGNVLKLTTNETAANKFELAVYDLRALTGETAGAEGVADLVRNLIHRSSWDDQRGPGYCTTLGNLLVVANERRLLRDVERFIDSLKEGLLDPPAGGDARQPRPLWTGWGPREEAVWRKLQMIESFEPRPVVLLDEVRRLCKQYDIPLAIDRQALRDAKADLSRIVMMFEGRESIQDRLWTLIHGEPMSLAIRQGALVVSTDAQYAESPALRLYWIGDLANSDAVAKAITDQLSANSGGGREWVRSLGEQMPGLSSWLVVASPRERLEQIGAPLAALRQEKAAKSQARSRAPAAENTPRVERGVSGE